MVLCGLGIQQYAMHNATIQKTAFVELGVYVHTAYLYMYKHLMIMIVKKAQQLKQTC